MTLNDELNNAISHAVEKATAKYVNGKIDRLTETVNKMSNKLDDHIVLMAPVKDALNWVNTTQKFIKWTGVPLVVLLVWIMGWFR